MHRCPLGRTTIPECRTYRRIGVLMPSHGTHFSRISPASAQFNADNALILKVRTDRTRLLLLHKSRNNIPQGSADILETMSR
jgi:hypothetical protein